MCQESCICSKDRSYTLEGTELIFVTCTPQFVRCLILKSFCTSVTNVVIFETDVVYDHIESMRYELAPHRFQVSCSHWKLNGSEGKGRS